jgi:glycosyltransferase involved in cell wall biosynthesis
MKIVFFTYGVLEQGGGFENFLIKTTSNLQNKYKDLDIVIISSSDRLTNKLQSSLSIYFMKRIDTKQIYRESHESIIAKLGNVRYIKADSLAELRSVLVNCDLIHTKNEIIELTVLKFIGLKKLPAIITGIHTPILYPYPQSVQSRFHNFVYPIFYKFVLKKIKGVYVQNDTEYTYLKDRIRYKGVLTKINQGIEFNKVESKIKLNKTKNFHVLFVGRLTEQKGIDVLVNTIRLLSREPNFTVYKFRIAGAGDSDLMKKIEDLSNSYDNIEYFNHVAHNNINKLYDWADCVIIPSRYETLCMVAIEAGLHGKISLASNIPGPTETIVNNETGFLLPLDANKFSEKLKEIHLLKTNNQERFNNMGKKAQYLVLHKFNVHNALSEMYGFIQKTYSNG